MTATLTRVPRSTDLPGDQRKPDAWPRLATGVLDLLDEGVLVVSRDFRLLGVNRPGEQLLRDADGLSTVRGSVVASTPSANFELRRGIERTARGEARRLEIPRPGRPGLSVHVEPHPGEAGSRAAVVFARDPERRRETGRGAIARHYGFTPTECDVAQQLAAGAPLGDIAQRLGITLNTVRGHLKHLYTKAGVHRQAELVAKLLAG